MFGTHALFSIVRLTPAFPEPPPGGGQPFLQSDFDFIPQVGLGQTNGRKRMPNLPGARGIETGRDFPPDNPLQKPQQFKNADPLSARDVEDSPGNIGFFHGQEIGLNNILYISKVPGLPPIAVDDGRVALPESLEELGDDGGIDRLRILTGAEDVKISKGYGF
jgi:hypothetical protein